MTYKVNLLILLTLLIFSIKGDSIELFKHIQESNVENVFKILDEVTLTPNEKYALLDLAQNIIIQRNSNAFWSHHKNLSKKALALQISSILLFLFSFYPVMDALDSKNLSNKTLGFLYGLS